MFGRRYRVARSALLPVPGPITTWREGLAYATHHSVRVVVAVRQALAQRGIESIDLTPVLRQWASKGEALFFAAHRYPNAQGHAFMAHALIRHLAASAQTYGLTPWEQETPQPSVRTP